MGEEEGEVVKERAMKVTYLSKEEREEFCKDVTRLERRELRKRCRKGWVAYYADKQPKAGRRRVGVE